MANNNVRLFTSESVTEGHPDKICDQISDAILDEMLHQDPKSRVAVESAATTGQVHVLGEVTTEAYVEIPQVIRQTLREIGYTSSEMGFDADSCGVLVSIGQQSPDINQGVDREDGELGAGDQGLMFGYATDETEQLFPLPALIAHKMALRLSEVRKSGIIEGLRPDGKTQVTVEYVDDIPTRIDTVVVSTQHSKDWVQNELRAAIQREVIDHTLAEIRQAVSYPLDVEGYKVHINPTGQFIIGGPQGDAGLTGRKIIVDTYGGMARHGGGAFSGKDPSKVDRSAAYAMRWVAKNIVASGLAKRAEVQVAYAIGVAEPVGLFVETFGTGTQPDAKIAEAVLKVFDLRPAGIIRELDLLRPIYRKTAAYGHFGRDEADFTWERTNKADELRAYFA